MNIPRAIGLAQAIADPVITAKTGEAALAQVEAQREVAREILRALDALEDPNWCKRL